MKILGIHDAIDSGAAVIEDGKILAAISEERVIRAKLAYGFPRAAIKEVLRVSGTRPEELSHVAVATKDTYLVDKIVPFKGWYETRSTLAKTLFMSVAAKVSPYATRFRFLEDLYYGLRTPLFMQRRRRVREILRTEFGVTCPIEFIDHHKAHASATYYASGYKDATVVTLDGGGDGLSSSVYEVRNGNFLRVNANSSLDSIGNFYSYVTHICGFTTHKHEGKITGLAAYGKPTYLEQFRLLIEGKDGQIINKQKLFATNAIRRIRSFLPEGYSMADLAASIQQILEEIATGYVRYWLRHTKLGNLALAGGVCANVKVNQRLHELPEVKSIFVNPAMGDDGISAGAALSLYYDTLRSLGKTPEPLRCIDHVYLGPEFSDQDIERAVKAKNLKYEYLTDVEPRIAKLLAEGYVVARFNGRMEYGPRALGNRSILCQAIDPAVNDWLNKNLKRTEFMPFAPSTLIEYADKCYLNLRGAEEPARFMTITFDCTDWMKRHCAGVVHVDGTARPQLVSKKENPSYYRIIEEYHKLTGLPSLVNTSFNIHEEPIVCTPEDAIRAFEIGHLDYLALGPFLLQNPKPLSRPLKRHLSESAVQV